MKFAVVEYSSKTGSIWKHTVERPNYLCDPIREIDPTSFGCYVSALEGEHIPLISLIVGAAVPLPVRIYRKIVKRFIGKWPLYDTSYLGQFNALLVVYQLSDGHEMVRLVQQLRKKYPHQAIIGVPTQPYGILKSHWESVHNAKEEIQKFMDACHVFLTIVERTTPAWQQLTVTPVLYMPQPYPAQFAAEHYKTRQEKDPIIFVAGVTGRDTITKGQLVAAALQKKFPEYKIQMASIPDTELDVQNLVGTQYEIIPFEPWQKHLETLSKVTLVINTDYTQTRGRVQADCAAVGTPSIGANSDAQQDLFPTLPADRETSIEELVAQGEELLNNAHRYEEVTNTAQDRLKKYDYMLSKQRMEQLVNDTRKKIAT